MELLCFTFLIVENVNHMLFLAYYCVQKRVMLLLLLLLGCDAVVLNKKMRLIMVELLGNGKLSESDENCTGGAFKTFSFFDPLPLAQPLPPVRGS